MEKQILMSNLSLNDFLNDQLKDPEFAAEYLNAFLEDGTPEEIAAAMSAILRARNASNSTQRFDPVVKQIQEFMETAGLRWSAQPSVHHSSLSA